MSRGNGEAANLRRPCMIIDNPEVPRKSVWEYVVPQGREHAEDIIRDPKVVRWIDDYARRTKELTEAEWQRKIEDPNSRWHKGNEEYQLLSRFAETSPPPGSAVKRR